MTTTTKNLGKTFLFLTTCAPLLFGANRVVSNAGVIVNCPARYTTIAAAIAAAKSERHSDGVQHGRAVQ
jgi:hypothetical protein